ncbi:hypothetical protein V5O48_001256 [Marasmius crinis-equi]|uniref:Uncharacterized protein n=1 Tax=Marasmius crinis-equi TaxID=585013 RepID=A0ABR3FZQ0_9AGAR
MFTNSFILKNASCCPIAVVACYSGSSHDDHHLVVTSVRDYLNKLMRNSVAAPASVGPSMSMPAPSVPHAPTDSGDWMPDAASEFTSSRRPETEYDHHDEH